MYRNLSLLLAIVAWLVPALALAQADMTYEGMVVSAGEGKIGILTKTGENRAFAVAKDAKITIDGKPATLDKVNNGHTAKITTKKTGDLEMAVVIEAKPKA
jgi:hypothetical protein